jgi:hypothetical protein
MPSHRSLVQQHGSVSAQESWSTKGLQPAATRGGDWEVGSYVGSQARPFKHPGFARLEHECFPQSLVVKQLSLTYQLQVWSSFASVSLSIFPLPAAEEKVLALRRDMLRD